MKKNLLNFVGAIVSCLSIFFLGAPYLVQNGSNNNYSINIYGLLGMSSNNNITGYVTIQGLLIIAAIIIAFISLVIVISAIVTDKKVSTTLLTLSVINVLVIFFTAKTLNSYIDNSTTISSSSSYAAGWGIIIVLVFFASSFVLSLIQFILDIVEIKKNQKESEYDEIYRFKKLLDDGIITQEDYDKKKNEFLESTNANV